MAKSDKNGKRKQKDKNDVDKYLRTPPVSTPRASS